jgi:hypothetical protein
MKNLYLLLLSLGGALILSACQGTSSTTNTGTCNYNTATGYYTNSTTGAVCSSSTSTAGCTLGANGQYINPTTGGLCTSSTTGSCVMTAQGYYINTTTGAICSSTGVTGTYGSNPCAYLTAQYGVPYQVTYVNGGAYCVASY